jgi:hypothetical protein
MNYAIIQKIKNFKQFNRGIINCGWKLNKKQDSPSPICFPLLFLCRSLEGKKMFSPFRANQGLSVQYHTLHKVNTRYERFCNCTYCTLQQSYNSSPLLLTRTSKTILWTWWILTMENASSCLLSKWEAPSFNYNLFII